MSESSSRHCLYVANFVFLVLALTILSVGLWAQFDPNFDDWVRTVESTGERGGGGGREGENESSKGRRLISSVF